MIVFKSIAFILKSNQFEKKKSNQFEWKITWFSFIAKNWDRLKGIKVACYGKSIVDPALRNYDLPLLKIKIEINKLHNKWKGEMQRYNTDCSRIKTLINILEF